MPNVTIEYVILIPLLFTQVILFPLVASTMASNWQDSQRDIELQDVANHLASTIQQLYLTVNRDEILVGTVTQVSTIPVTVASYSYSVTGSLSDPPDGSAKILIFTLILDDVGNTVTASAVLGPNVNWIDSTLRSDSADAYIELQKFSNGTLTFSFGG
ncbi:MAG: hypothetical protein NWF06_08255 [Candidatus Bathyarchaeota archaeon]|nr:hypothetical protein [Candidatus Bathyarchaeum sp.]